MNSLAIPSDEEILGFVRLFSVCIWNDHYQWYACAFIVGRHSYHSSRETPESFYQAAVDLVKNDPEWRERVLTCEAFLKLQFRR